MFDKFKQPLKIKKGTYAYISHPRTMLLPKLTLKTFGPFPVMDTSYQPFMKEIVGVTVNFGTKEMPIPKRFARARIHSLRYINRDLDWNWLTKNAKELHYGTQDFLNQQGRAIDDTYLTIATNNQIAVPGLLSPEDNKIQRIALLSALQDNKYYFLYD